MTPIYLDTPASNSFALASDHHQEHHDHQLKLFIAPPYQIDHYGSSSSSTFFNTIHDQSSSNPFHHQHQHGYNDLVYNNVWHDETSDHQVSPSSSNHPIISDNLKSSIITTSINGDNNDTNKSPNGLTVKWVSSKMRMMRKMMNNSNCAAATTKDVSDEQPKHHDHDHQRQLRTTPSTQINYFENGNNDFIRVCSSCNTTKTPLWRGGPCGPKSLCNACGIRQRKARRAMEAAAAATNGTILDTTTDTSSSSSTKTTYKVIKKEKKLHKNQYKKKCKLDIDHDIQEVMICDNNEYESTNNNKKTCFEEFALNLLSKNSGFRGVFPQDEEEGAILLMALSCGLA